MAKDAIQILKERAVAAAHVEEQVAIATVPLSLFIRGKQVYGLRLGEVEGAGRLRQLSHVPGAPAWMVGAVQHRGSILTLVDLAPFWNVEIKGLADLPTFLVISDGSQRLGLLVEELLGVHEVDAAIQPYRGDERAGISEVAHLGNQAVLVLSAARLMQDARLKAT
ncbi:MAG TPA: chemotaxis protein CheW [Myxococcaceae bacterium]